MLQQFFNRKKKEVEYREIEFMQKYWVVEIVLLELTILLRYLFYFYYVEPTTDVLNTKQQLEEFLGLSYTYPYFLHIGFTKTDYASESIFFTLFFFSAMQMHVYKSKSKIYV